MKRKTKLFIGVTSCVVAVVFTYSVILYATTQKSTVFDQVELANSEFKIRVTAYRDFFPYALPSARYVFQSAILDSDEWQGNSDFQSGSSYADTS
jgi:hypothetical protein